jgi:hypothetical protein
MVKLYLIRHAESCSNIVRDDLSTLHDKPKSMENKENNQDGLFPPDVMKKLRSADDKNGIYSSIHFHPSLSYNGINQVKALREYFKTETLTPDQQIAKEDIFSNNKTLYISSATLRTVMTSLIFLKENIEKILLPSNVENITKQFNKLNADELKRRKENYGPNYLYDTFGQGGEGKGKLIKIYPHINEAMSSKVSNYIKDDQSNSLITADIRDKFNQMTIMLEKESDAKKEKERLIDAFIADAENSITITTIENFIQKNVRADFGIPHEIIIEVITLGIKWLIANNYLDTRLNVDDVLKLIDFEYYIDYCKTQTEINPYLQNVKKFKELLNLNPSLENESIVVLFVHFKVILTELVAKEKIVGKDKFDSFTQADMGDNASIWLETADLAQLTLTDIKLIHEGPKIRTDDRQIEEEDESICYVLNDGLNDGLNDEKLLTYNVDIIYNNMSEQNSTTKFTYFNKSVLNELVKIPTKKKTGGAKYKTRKNKKGRSKKRANRKKCTTRKHKKRHTKRY